eukprot:TRINITY_DN15535_c0_g1_i1.p1 TRINITY_DN15535_c0_g1~~TRINITY_DN15535_c0_g1_i1.p1  ORF type:complete len:306 (-),score=81.48 TRINITY_DN15535_c0_g1_i1:272-1189(-)
MLMHMHARACSLGNSSVWKQNMSLVMAALGVDEDDLVPAQPKPRAEARQILSQFETWVHPDILKLRTEVQLPGVATTLCCSIYGEQMYELNEPMREQFADLDEVHKDIIGREIPELSHRIVSMADRELFLKGFFGTLLSIESPDETKEYETLAHFVTKDGRKVLGHMVRTIWVKDTAIAYFQTLRILPKSKHLIPMQELLKDKVASKSRKKQKTKPTETPGATTAQASPALLLQHPQANNAPSGTTQMTAGSEITSSMDSQVQLSVDTAAPAEGAPAEDPDVTDLIMSLLMDPEMVGLDFDFGDQ